MSGSRDDDDMYFHKKAKGNVWLDDETEILVQFYSEELSQTPTVGKYRPIQSYMNIAKKLKAIGYSRSPHQVRNKIKSLRASYYAARRGSDLDRQHCFMYDELDKCFRDSSRDLPHNHDDMTQLSSDDPIGIVEPSSSHKRRRQFTEANIVHDRNEFYEESEGIHNDYYGECDDDELNLSSRKSKKPRITTTTTNIERISLDDNAESTLVEFMADQLEKQRQHQLEVTKIFTTAMNDQFKKFSDLISNLTQQMFEYSRSKQVVLNTENKITEILDDMPSTDA